MAFTRGLTTIAVLLVVGFTLRSTTVSQAGLADDERPVALWTWAVPKFKLPKPDASGPAGTGGPHSSVSQISAGGRGATTMSMQRAPVGVPGRWRLTFDDEFSGTRLDTSKWVTHNGWTKQNNVTTLASNVAVFRGEVRLALSDANHGSAIATEGSPTNYELPVGGVVEARVYLPGDSRGSCWNWPAWWVSGPQWPRAGEHDVAEVLRGKVTTNYHSPSGAHNNGPIVGATCGRWHTYGLHRKAGYAEVILDGKVVRRYTTDDSGAPEGLLLSHGVHGRTDRTPTHAGRLNAVRVDYVRAWAPAR